MSIGDIIRPIRKEHSIKEAVITVFLSSPIIKPERFEELIKSEFKDYFQRFETVSSVELKLSNTKGSINAESFEQQNAGFKFSAFDEGRLVNLLQGINEKGRYYLSFHTLTYSSWKMFFKQYQTYIEVLSKKHNEIFINAFALQYVDEFLWNDEIKSDTLKLIFNEQSDYLHKDFFNNTKNLIRQITEREDEDNRYLSRLEILTEPEIRPLINIKHIITQSLDEPVELQKVIPSDHFNDMINKAHDCNKKLLNDILSKDVKTLIGLIKD